MNNKICRECKDEIKKYYLISPCKCDGPNKYIHSQCIKSPSCNACGFTYVYDKKRSYLHYFNDHMGYIIIIYSILLAITFFSTHAFSHIYEIPCLSKLFNPFLIINIDTLIFGGIAYVIHQIILRKSGAFPRAHILILSSVIMIHLDLILSNYLIDEWLDLTTALIYISSASLMCIGFYLISTLVSFSMKLAWRQYKDNLDDPPRVISITK